ncbi:glycosyltransferase family 39 protein [Patescibacteria group bacterium]|nr:glycosyltransferase family 39 protein [Patescibacteria group bacterium]
MLKSYKIKITIFLLVILSLAGFLRLYGLHSVPPGLYPDEAMNANDALTNPGKVFYPENGGREGLFVNLVSLSFKILGSSPFSLRLVSAIIGIITVLGLFLLVKELLKHTSASEANADCLALLASFFIATSFWHINFSRIGFRGILLPFILVFCFYFLFKGLRNKNIFLLILAGLTFGLGFYTYSSFRLAFLILPFVLIPYWIAYYKEKQQKKFILSVFIFGISALIIVLPLIFYFLSHPADFFGRLGAVSVFSQPNFITAFLESLGRHLIMFNISGDFNWRHNFSGSPQLFWPIGILFLIGFIVSIKKLIFSIKNKNLRPQSIYWLLFSWFFVMILPGALTYEGLPHSLRTIGLIPAVMIFAAFGALWVLEKIKKIKRLPSFAPDSRWQKWFLYLIIGFVFLSLFVASTQKYFIDWAQNSKIKGAFTENFVKIGEAINALPPETNKYVIVNESGTPVPYPDGVSTPAQTIMFMERMKYGTLKAKYLKLDQLGQIWIADRATAVIPMHIDDDILNKLRTTFPGGTLKTSNNVEIYWITPLK